MGFMTLLGLEPRVVMVQIPLRLKCKTPWIAFMVVIRTKRVTQKIG
jgi:hypothetical protein